MRGRGARPRVRLFCFPYAGGAASVFAPLAPHLPASVDLRPVQLPGRESRFHDAPIARLDPLVRSLAASLLPYLTPPFAFLGHSMGALVGFELAHFLRAHDFPLPTHLFAAGCSAPQVFDVEPKVHALPDGELIEELRRLEGTPESVLRDPELMQLLLPVLRADFAVCETYVYEARPPLACPIAVFGGTLDPVVSGEQLAAWGAQTTDAFAVHLFDGGHFFLHACWPALAAHLAAHLDAPSRGRAAPAP